jgi:hypothetical protein
MKPLNLNDVVTFVENNIGDFHRRRAENLQKLKLAQVIKSKNPYLFKAKNITTAQDLVKSLVDAYLSSQEEAIFGEFLEKLAIFVCGQVFDGKKSSAEGIDLEFERDNVRYIVSIKSGPNWGNSSQIKRMKENFKQAQRILRTSNSTANIQAVNGCCYGKDSRPNKGDYQKLCGQVFWEFISGDDRLFVDIVEPLGHRAKQRNDKFAKEYSRILNNFTNEFFQEFCTDGNINWEKLVRLNSEKKKPKEKKTNK